MATSTQRRLGSWKNLLIGLGVLLLLGAGLLWYLQRRHFVWTNDAYIDGYQISISPDVEARVIELLVDEGDLVAEGELLCRLDESILNSQKKDAETTIALLEETVKLQRIEMEKRRDIYRVALQEFENAIISFIDFDKIEKDFRYSEARLKVSEASLVNGIAKLGVIEELLHHTKIVAPRKGAISKRWVTAGDMGKIGTPLFVLTDIENIYITANLEEYKMKRLRPGNKVNIHIDAYPNHTFQGEVFAIRQSAASQFSLIPPENATGNFTKVVQRVPVKILFNVPKAIPPLYLYPGMSVEVDVKVK